MKWKDIKKVQNLPTGNGYIVVLQELIVIFIKCIILSKMWK